MEIHKKVVFGYSGSGKDYFWYLPTDKHQRPLNATSQTDALKKAKIELEKIIKEK